MRRKFFSQILLVLLLSFIIFLAIYGLNQFRLRRVYLISPAKINNGLGILNGENLLFLDRDKISRYLLQQNIEVKSAEIRKILPNTLVIILNFRQPIAKISNNFAKDYYLDDEGVLLPFETKSWDDAPIIEAGSISLLIGAKPDWRVAKIIEYINGFKREDTLVQKIIVDENMLAFHFLLADGIEVIAPQVSDANLISASLQIITSRFRIEGKLITMVDFRFEKPIIIFSNGEKISSE